MVNSPSWGGTSPVVLDLTELTSTGPGVSDSAHCPPAVVDRYQRPDKITSRNPGLSARRVRQGSAPAKEFLCRYSEFTSLDRRWASGSRSSCVLEEMVLGRRHTRRETAERGARARQAGWTDSTGDRIWKTRPVEPGARGVDCSVAQVEVERRADAQDCRLK